MRSLNLRLLTALLVGVSVLAVGTFLLHEYQLQRLAFALRTHANRAREARDAREAESLLARYVAMVPNDADALEELGVMQRDRGRLEQSFFTLERCLRIDPRRSNARRQLVEIALELGRNSEAQGHLDHLLADSPVDPNILVLKGRCQVARRDFSGAVATFRQVVDLSPQSLDTYIELAEVTREHLGNSAAADEYLQRLVQRNPKDPNAYVKRGVHQLERQVKVDDLSLTGAKPLSPEAIQKGRDVALSAQRDARKALELEPGLPSALLLASRSQLLLGTVAEARISAQQYLASVKQRKERPASQVFSLLAAIELHEKQPQGAILWLRRGLEAQPKAYDLRWNLAILELESNRFVEAETTIQHLAGAAPLQPLVEYFHARRAIAAQEWLSGMEKLERVRSSLESWPEVAKQANFWLGICYEQVGNADQQLLALRRAVAIDPLWVPARLALARSLLALGRLQESLEQYSQASNLPDAPAALLVDAARLTILLNLQKDPAERNWQAVLDLLNAAEKQLPDSMEVVILQAEILLAQGLRNDAQSLLESQRETHPDSEELWLALAALAERNEDWERSLQILQEAQRTLGDRVRTRLALARYHVLRSEKHEAITRIKELAVAESRFNDADRLTLESGMAGLLLTAGDYGAAEAICQKVAREQPSNLRVRLLLFDLAHRARKTEGMTAVLNELEKIEGAGPLWQYGTAVGCSVRGELDQALRHLAEAALLRPAWSRIPLLRAQILKAQEKTDAAIASYLEAIDLGERQAEVITQTIELLVQRERWVEVDRLFRRLESQNAPFSESLMLIASDVSLRLQDSERSLNLVMQLKKKGLKSIADRIFVARILYRLKQPQDAEEVLREAVLTDPTAPAGWIALIQFLGQTGQSQKATEEITRAESSIDSSRRSLAIAQCYDSIGEVSQAERYYELATEEHPNDPLVDYHFSDYRLRHGQTDLAEPLLRRLAEQSTSSAVRNQAWARRNLALISAKRGGLENLRIAKLELEKNLNDDPRSAPDLSAKAIVLASQGWPEARSEAIQILLGLVDRAEGLGTDESGEIRFLLARLLLADGNWAQSAKAMQTLLARRGSEVRYISWYADAMLDRGELSEADLWIRKLVQLAPAELSTATFQARSAFLRNRDSEALEILNGFVASQAAKNGTRVESDLRNAALTLEGFGRKRESGSEFALQYLNAAESVLKQYIVRRPHEKLALSAFYSRVGRLEEGLSLLEQHATQAKAEEVVAICALFIGKDSTRATYGRRIAAVLESTLETQNRPVPLLLCLADYLTMQASYDEAEAVFREVLKKAPGNLIATNNFALLLALHPKNPRPSEGLQAVNSAIEKLGTGPSLIDTRAIIYLTARKPQLALEDANRAVAMQPAAGHHFHRAQAAVALGNREIARKAWQQAKSSGLTQDSLHPLERRAYALLSRELDSP